MYKNNSQNISKFKGCSPLQLLCILTKKCNAVGYYSYTHHCAQLQHGDCESKYFYRNFKVVKRIFLVKNYLKLWYIFTFITVIIGCGRLQQKEDKVNYDISKITSDTLLWNIEELYETPNYRVVDSGRVLSIVYEAMEFNDTIREVFAYYSNPSILSGSYDNVKKKYPGVVLAHGGGGRAFSQWVEKWASEGYAAIAYDMSARDGIEFFNKKPGPKSTTTTKFYNISNGPEKMWTTFAVGSTVRAHSLLLSRPEVDKNRTAITGISWGGYITCIAAGIDNRFKAACPVYGCGFYDEMAPPIQNFSLMTNSEVELWLRNLDPKHYLPNIKCPIFFINGNRDFFFEIIPHSKSYSLVNDSLRQIRIVPDMLHSHEYGWAPFEIKYFFNNILNSQFPLPKVHTPIIVDSLIIAKFDSPVSLMNCELWYSNDTTGSNIDREWKVLQGEIKNDSILIKNPGNDMVFGFIYIKDHRNLSVSSELFYQSY